jgi:Zn-dependent alcohol dehydrogenases
VKAVLLKPGSGAKVEEVQEPVPQKGEIVVELIACGLCGTDVERIRGGYSAGKAVLGHEAVGRVIEVGEGVDWLRKGRWSCLTTTPTAASATTA